MEHFKRVLANEVRIVSSLPSTHLMSRPVEEKKDSTSCLSSLDSTTLPQTGVCGWFFIWYLSPLRIIRLENKIIGIRKKMEIIDATLLTWLQMICKHMYKDQLQTYSQNRGLGLPEYACKREGLPHACRFSCKVTVAEKTYESPELYNTLKEAEHAAAKVALMALCRCSVPEDNSFVYKNLLQELAQKEFFCLPTYSAIVTGLPHMPTFVSTVEVKGEIFQGEIAKTKMQAEMNAAMVAYLFIKERGMSQSHEVIPATCQLQEATSSSLKPTLTVDLQENGDLIKKEDNEERAPPKEFKFLHEMTERKTTRRMEKVMYKVCHPNTFFCFALKHLHDPHNMRMIICL